MKIQKVSEANQAKAYALLNRVASGAKYEASLVQRLHENGKLVHGWVCLHTNKVIAYIGFSNAYHGDEVCGLHLAPMVVSPEFQKQGVGSELLRFALRQQVIKDQPLFVFGAPAFFQKFGFEPCQFPLCPLSKNNAHFLSLRNETTDSFMVGYEPEFKTVAKSGKPPKSLRAKVKKHR